MKFQNHLRGGITLGIATGSGFYLGKDTLNNLELFTSNNIEINTISILVFIGIFILFSILNDLDSIYSKVGKILLPISYPSHILSYLLYMVFYNSSYSARKRSINMNDGRGFLVKMIFPTSFKNKQTLFKIVHRMIYHTEIGLIIFLGLAYLVDIKVYDFNNLYYLGIAGGYITHLLLDWIHGKLPIPFLLRIIFIIIGKRKEMYGLNLRIGG